MNRFELPPREPPAKRHRRSPQRPREGSLMVCVLVCMAIVVSMTVMITQNASKARRETRLRLQLHQTSRLLDAGILRSRLKRDTDPDYTGETWTPALRIGELELNAAVTITIVEGKTKVTARLGESPQQTTQSYTFLTSTEQ